MPALTGAEETLLDTHRHRFKEYLAVLQPATVLACLLDGAPAGDPIVEIAFDNVSDGAFGDVVAGMTLFVGTSAGGRDKGTCRIRKAAAAAALYIAEDSAIDWVDNDHLTVVENYEYWVKYPRIVVAGDAITFYKDWELTYSDQHEDWPPVALMGPPDCQFIDADTGLATVNFVGNGSYAVAPGGSISTYAWVFPSGTPPNSAVAGTPAAPVAVTWDTAGIYWVTLTVTDDNAKTHVGRRPIFIFDRTGSGSPYTKFKMTGRNGDLNQHGHSTSFEIMGDADQAEFPDRAMVIYFTEDWYGDTKQSIGGNAAHRAHVKFVGYIQKESTTKDPETSVVKFDAATINALMGTREGFSSWIKTTGDATTWCEATALTADRAALSLCRNNSTILDVTDVIITGDTEFIKSQEFAAKTTLLQQLTSLYDDLFAHVACDKHGRLYFEVDPQMIPVADRAAIAITTTLDHGDWREKIDLPRPQEAKVSFVNMAGIFYAGHPAPVTPILSKAPGQAPGYMGATTEISGLILGGQADGNAKAGMAIARENNEFPDVTLPMAGHWDCFDIMPQEYVRISLAADDTKRGIVWVDQDLFVRRVTYRVQDTDAGRVALVDIQVEKDSYGPAGVDGDYPSDVPEVPPTNYPEPPGPPAPPGGEPDADGHLLYFVDKNNDEIYRSRNARAAVAASVVYEPLGFPGVGPRYLTLDSWDPKQTAMVCGDDGVWKTTDLNSDFPTWTQVIDMTGGDLNEHYIAFMAASSICQEGLWMVAVEVKSVWDDVYVYYTTTGGDTFADWTGLLVAGSPHQSGVAPKIEASSHNAQVAWITWRHNNGNSYFSKTVDQWASVDASTTFGSGTYPPAPHHRYFENASDLIALWGHGSTIRFCTDDCCTCTDSVLADSIVQVGTYTWGSTRYWLLAGTDLFYTSDDGLAWALAFTFPNDATRFISGWPYLAERFYACQDGVTAPILISGDRGASWTEQTGNWAAAQGVNTPQIYCCVPVWIE